MMMKSALAFISSTLLFSSPALATAERTPLTPTQELRLENARKALATHLMEEGKGGGMAVEPKTALYVVRPLNDDYSRFMGIVWNQAERGDRSVRSYYALLSTAAFPTENAVTVTFPYVDFVEAFELELDRPERRFSKDEAQMEKNILERLRPEARWLANGRVFLPRACLSLFQERKLDSRVRSLRSR